MLDPIKLFADKPPEELTGSEILVKAIFTCLSFLMKVEEFEGRLLEAEKSAKKS
jgi:hypothetical protein